VRALVCAALAVFTALPAGAQPLPEAPAGTIGYDSVDAALAALKKKHGVVFSTENGWTIASDKKEWTIWSFAPATSPAYPAVVKRQLVPSAEGVETKMSVMCKGSKADCDALVRSFNALNQQAQDELE
jgi:hypothetical protein